MKTTLRSVLWLTLVLVVGVALLLGGIIIGRSGWGMSGYGLGMMGNFGSMPHTPGMMGSGMMGMAGSGMMNRMGGSMADMMKMHHNSMQPSRNANPSP